MSCREQVALHDGALAVLTILLDAESHTRSLGKSLVDAPVLHGRALEVAQRAYATRDLETVVVGDHGPLLAGLARLGVFLVVTLLAEIALERHEDELSAWAVVGDFAHPLGLYVLERVFAVD